AFVANAASDDISVIDVGGARVTRTIPIKWTTERVFGSMPCALAVKGRTLYVCNGGDNAICEIDLPTPTVQGFPPARYFSVAIGWSRDGPRAFVLNTKGNGSVAEVSRRPPHNSHDFRGSVSVIDLRTDLGRSTERVARNNGWDRDRDALHPNLAV